MGSRTAVQTLETIDWSPLNASDAAGNITSAPQNAWNKSSISHNEKSRDMESQDEPNADRWKFRRSPRDMLKFALRLKDDSDPTWCWSNLIDEKVRSLDDYPQGHGKLAAFQDMDPSFSIIRKFKWLHNRALLWRQDELTILEKRLEGIDRADAKINPKRLRSRYKDMKCDSVREDLISEIEGKLAAYDELLFRVQRLNNIKQPTKQSQTHVKNFIKVNECQDNHDQVWIRLSHDLAALAPNPRDRFKALLEALMIGLSRRLTLYIFRSKSQRLQTGKAEALNLISVERIEYAINIAITILATAFILVPVGILSWMISCGYSLTSEILVVFGSTLVFAAFCAVIAQAQKHQVFTLTAAYTGVLVIFLGINLQAQTLQLSQSPS